MDSFMKIAKYVFIFYFSTFYIYAADQSFLIKANELNYQKDLETISAEGDVEITGDKQTLKADKIIHNRKENTVTAIGNIALTQEDGTVIFGEYIHISGDFKEGVIKKLSALLVDQSRLTAQKGFIKRDNTQELERTTFSPCKLCPDNLFTGPLWQMESRRSIHDKNDHTITHRDAWIKFFGIPTIYTPYFSHADNTVDRKAGFLLPTVRQSGDLGWVFKTPYYYPFSTSSDMILAPMATTKGEYLVHGEFRHLHPLGRLHVDWSGAILKNSVNKGILRKENELAKTRAQLEREKKNQSVDDDEDSKFSAGHIFLNGEYHVTDHYKFGVELQQANNRTYLDRYNFSGLKVLQSQVFMEGLWNHDYLYYGAIKYQGLRTLDRRSLIPRIAPLFEFSSFHDLDSLGYAEHTTDFMYLTRRGDADFNDIRKGSITSSKRISSGFNWILPIHIPLGMKLTSTAGAKGDIYDINNAEFPLTNPKNPTLPIDPKFLRVYTGHKGRFYPHYALEWSYPWCRSGKRFEHIIEPITSFVTSPRGQNSDRIPNEDSLGFTLTESRLFDPNMYAGHDRVSGSTRMDYALDYSIHKDGKPFVKARLGQSYNFTSAKDFPKFEGMRKYYSDIVSSLYVTPFTEFDAYARARWDYKKKKIARADLGTLFNLQPFLLTTTYTFSRTFASGQLLKRTLFAKTSQITNALSYRLHDYWTYAVSVTHNIQAQKIDPGTGLFLKRVPFEAQTYTHSLLYQDECFTGGIKLVRDRKRNQNIKPRHDFLFTFGMKYFGTFETAPRKTETKAY
jgi:LPS-assembly protein